MQKYSTTEIQEIENLTSGITKNYEVMLNSTDKAIKGWQKAALNSFRVHDGSGTLIRNQNRVYILTAKHVTKTPLISYGHPEIPVSKENKAFLTKIKTRTNFNDLDYAILEFVDPSDEKFIAKRYGGVSLIESTLQKGQFIFQLGYPNSWPLNRKHTRYMEEYMRGIIRNLPLANPLGLLPDNTFFNLVLSSGIVTNIANTQISTSARSGHGNSGGGIFVLTNNEAFLVSIVFGNGEAHGRQGNEPSHAPANIPDALSTPVWLDSFLL